MINRSSVFALALATLLLSACDTAKERAQKHFLSAMEFVQSGDLERAVVEFRNVFVLDESHREARRAYARLLRDAGITDEAYAQYVHLVEQYPDDLEGLVALSEMSVQAATWEDADRYIAAALKLDPDNQSAMIAAAMRDYTKAVAKDDVPTLDAVLKQVSVLRAKAPEDLTLRRIVITEALRTGDFELALSEVETAIRQSPEDQSLYALRLAIHMRQNDPAAIERELTELGSLFPDDPGVTDALLNWYQSTDEPEKAEDFLRKRLDAQPDDTRALGELLRFLAEEQGLDVAFGEIDRRIAATGGSTLLRSARASLLHDMGKSAEAIAEMRDLVAKAQPADDINTLKVALARILYESGAPSEGVALADEVLVADAGNVEALRLRSAWLIDADNTTDAIRSLRLALDAAPRDPGLMTLLAQAHVRDGDRDLARQQLALAVQASGFGTGETLRYARHLMADQDYLAAEAAMISTLRLRPDDPQILATMGEVYIALRDWPRAEGVAKALERPGTPEARASAVPVRMGIYQGTDKAEDGIAYLEQLVADGVAGQLGNFALAQAYLDAGRNDDALAVATTLLSAAPDDAGLQFFAALTRERTGDTQGAQAGYQAVIDAGKADVQTWIALARVQSENGIDPSDTLVRALDAFPDSAPLLWAKASNDERLGRIDEAIAIYERLYAAESGSDIAANNLASLLSVHRTDPESLQRAMVVARRLRGSTEPAFQDTYGWISYLSGDYELARTKLEAAVAVLGHDPRVRFHLAKTYGALGMTKEAGEQFSQLLLIVAPDDTRDFVVEAREFLNTQSSGQQEGGD